MIRRRASFCLSLVAAFVSIAGPAAADTYRAIVRGKVTMEDGSAPSFTVGIERICSDNSGSAPGPITNKKGEWVWNMEIDAFASRACFFRATHAGYTSTTLDASNINITSRDSTVDLQPLVISPTVPDPYLINASQINVPSKAKAPFAAAMKAVDANNLAEAVTQLQATVAAAPKFSQAWQDLGIIEDNLQKKSEAREAYQHAIENDPKLLPAYVALARVCIKTKDWQGAANSADSLIKADTKHLYPEIYLHQAVARYELKDLDGAQGSVQEALRLDPQHKRPRAEYVLGRILEAKNDATGAREHISKYIELDPHAPDIDVVKAHLQNLGKPPVEGLDPDLEPL